MLRNLIFALALLPASAMARPITDAEKVLVQEAVGYVLKDPASAQYRWQPEIDDYGTYCGHVNAKNAYGGYVGFQAFKVFIMRDNGQVIDPPTVVKLLWVARPREIYRTCPEN